VALDRLQAAVPKVLDYKHPEYGMTEWVTWQAIWLNGLREQARGSK
jgi:hypothetical protein